MLIGHLFMRWFTGVNTGAPDHLLPSLGPVVNILAIFSNANILKKYENKNKPHQRYLLSVIDLD